MNRAAGPALTWGQPCPNREQKKIPSQIRWQALSHNAVRVLKILGKPIPFVLGQLLDVMDEARRIFIDYLYKPAVE